MTDAFGSIVIGAVAGLLVVFGVWLLDHKLHIDDPVGAVAVHCMNGIWGTIAVGLFATDSAPAFARGYRRPEGSGTIRTRAGETSRHSARIWRGLFFYTKITEHGSRAVASFIWIHRMRAQSNIKRSSPLITRSSGRW